MYCLCTWDVLVSKLDVDDVVPRLRRAVGDLAGAVLYVLTVDVHFTGALDGQTQAPVTLATGENINRAWGYKMGRAYDLFFL